MKHKILLLKTRCGVVILLAIMLVVISLVTRTALLVKSLEGIEFTAGNLLGIFSLGLLFDLVNASYLLAPLILYLLFLPSRLYNTRWHIYILYGISFTYILLLLFNAVSEWFFWDEFNARFNFIAVDYLVYTTEVIGNIRQSYPIEWIIACIAIVSFAIVYLLRSWIKIAALNEAPFKLRLLRSLAFLTLPVLFFFTIDNKMHQFSANAFVNELSGNGLYELFAAYRNNELDYEQFYKTVSNKTAFRKLRSLLKTRESRFIGNDPFSIQRVITNKGPEKRLNVILISVESLSADFLGIFGNTKNITPNLDSLSQHSLLFTNIYATGTRTVRGLEALSLCIPPTPGQSIVRRPHNEHLFSLGKVFDDKGYESKYIYGGYGYFDNMNYFFANNGYEVDDRSKLADSEIDYENIWGVADENLFALAEREIETTLKKNRPVFAHIMTTSNHRPYTYPEGRIDIPSHSNREGAVKYTDYAIGKFIKDASKKPWFNSTVFVIVADHCASSAGATELPVNKYKIPLLIYSPSHVTPGKMDRLMSQIDLGPTLLGMLNFSYTSNFFGYDMNQLEPGRERAFISTYQSLGFLKHDTLVVLHPGQHIDSFQPNYTDGSVSPLRNNFQIMEESIAWYQVASYEFKHGLLR